MDLQELAKEAAAKIYERDHARPAEIAKYILHALETAVGEHQKSYDQAIAAFSDGNSNLADRVHEVSAECGRLKLELEQARKDGERIEWLEDSFNSNPHGRFDKITDLANRCSINHAATVRGLIDTARQAGGKEGL